MFFIPHYQPAPNHRDRKKRRPYPLLTQAWYCPYIVMEKSTLMA